jgi:outer membrane protein assembly factor BamB
MKKCFALAAAFALVTALPTAAAAQDPAKPKPEQKTEDAAKPSYAGKWSLSLQSPNGTMAATVNVVLDEKEPAKVAGSITSEMGTSNIYGEIAEGVLWFAVSPDGTNEIWFKGELQADGSMSGAIDIQGNLVPWTATRIKDK